MKGDWSEIDPEVQEWLDELTNETITRAQWTALREHIRCDPAVRAAYLEAMQFEAVLQREFSGSLALLDEPLAEERPRPTAIKRFWMPMVAGAAAVLGIGLYGFGGGFWNVVPGGSGLAVNEGGGEQRPLAPRGTVARITASEQAQWEGKNTTIGVGTWLKPGSYSLKEGNAKITFDSGATVVMTPGTTFEVVDSNSGFLHKGAVSSHAPESAIGFLINTPGGRIEDLGTRFGLSVNESGVTDVHVLEGLVEASNAGSDEPVTVVTARKAMRLEDSKAPSSVDYQGERYAIRMDETSGQNQTSYVHYSFDDLQYGDETLADEGVRQDGENYAASFRTYKDQTPVWSVTEGRFGDAIYLGGDGSYMRTNYRKITGNSARTIAFWIKIPPNTKIEHSYAFAAWGVPRTLQGQKWQLGWNPNFKRSCGVEGAIRTEFGKGYVTGTTDLRDGRWHHVVSVFLGDNGQHISSQIRHYVDGKLEGVSSYDDEDADINTLGGYKPLLIGRYLNFHHPVFKGVKAWMDEFYLFEAALTPAQIRKLYLENTPPGEGEYLPSLFLGDS